MEMKPIPQATVFSLTAEERHAMEALAGSRKGEARMRDRASTTVPDLFNTHSTDGV
jgi:hypothetical protein